MAARSDNFTFCRLGNTHSIKHDRTREHGALANPGGRPRRTNPGATVEMANRDPDGNFVEMQIDAFAEPDDATAYMNGPEYAADSVGPGFDPEVMLEARRNGATVEELTSRAFCVDSGLPAPIEVLTSAP
jgi:hypothetical protein